MKKNDFVQSVENYPTIFFQQKTRRFYENGINKLVEQRKTVVKNYGDYVLD